MHGTTAPKHHTEDHLTIINARGTTLICMRENKQLQVQSNSSWRLVFFFFNPSLLYNAAVRAQQGAHSHDEITRSTSYASQSWNMVGVQQGERLPSDTPS